MGQHTIGEFACDGDAPRDTVLARFFDEVTDVWIVLLTYPQDHISDPILPLVEARPPKMPLSPRKWRVEDETLYLYSLCPRGDTGVESVFYAVSAPSADSAVDDGDLLIWHFGSPISLCVCVCSGSDCAEI